MQAMCSQPQNFTDSVFSFLSKKLNCGIAGRWQKRHRDFMVNCNSFITLAIHQFCSEFNCLHRKLNTEFVNYCGWLYISTLVIYILKKLRRLLYELAPDHAFFVSELLSHLIS